MVFTDSTQPFSQALNFPRLDVTVTPAVYLDSYIEAEISNVKVAFVWYLLRVYLIDATCSSWFTYYDLMIS